MNRIAILTDTTADLTPGLLALDNVFTLPLQITEGDNSYEDTINITVNDIYMNQDRLDYKTSLPARDRVISLLDNIIAKGYDSVLVLTLSSGLSGTSNAIRLIATEYPDLRAEVLDTREASVGELLLVVEAVKLINFGVSMDDLISLMNTVIDNTTVFFSLDTLSHLEKGGRISKASAFCGNLLSIKPILSFDENGTIVLAGKTRGKKAIIPKLLELIDEKINSIIDPELNESFNLAIAVGENIDEGEALIATLKERYPQCSEIFLGIIDATLAVHLGQGIIGIGISKTFNNVRIINSKNIEEAFTLESPLDSKDNYISIRDILE